MLTNFHLSLWWKPSPNLTYMFAARDGTIPGINLLIEKIDLPVLEQFGVYQFIHFNTSLVFTKL